MTDTRVRVPLNGKQVRLDQLDQETGGHGLVASAAEVIAIEGSPVTATDLDAAVAAHVPVWPPTVEQQLAAALERIETLEAQVAGL